MKLAAIVRAIIAEYLSIFFMVGGFNYLIV